MEGNIAWLKLAPAAGLKLHQITAANEDYWLEISVDGVDAVKALIFTPVDPGIVQVSRPSEELQTKLRQYQ